MVLFDDRTGVEVMDRRECLELLSAEEIGRIAVLEGGQPLIVPVNYALDGDAIVIRTGPGSKLRASRGGPACFEIDGFELDQHAGWSVVVRGRLEAVLPTDSVTLDRVANMAHPWIGDRPDVIRLAPDVITGRRIRPLSE